MTEAQVEQAQPDQPAIVTIDDVKYDRSSITEVGEGLIINLQRLNSRIAQMQFDLQMASVAQAKISSDLQAELVNFTVVPE